MRRVLPLLRFFRVVPPVPPLMHAALLSATALAAGVIWASPARAAGALTPLLLLQLFAAASGFMVPARRGHYDLLLTSGEARVAIAAASWLMSVFPGVLGWGALAIVETIVTRGAQASLLSSGTAAAVALVSTVPWAATVALPRFAGAIAWLASLATLATVASPPAATSLFESIGGGASPLEAVAALTLYPPLLVGQHIVGAQGLIVLPPLLLASASMLYAFVWIHRQDIPLEAAQ